ncbi:MAG: histidine kinase dimerization/phospho-acceptor domain-containing protein [Prochloraceae cyanobacterium]|nr:histidine kinase dimerization/phospho-acceptor domain-containing protein [Prochloraceae cyanobacterium]
MVQQFSDQLNSVERVGSQIIAIVAHKLQTPLSTIQVCLESLANEPEIPREYRQVLIETALTDLDRLYQLVQDSLNFSESEKRQIGHHSELTQLKEALENVAKLAIVDKLEQDYEAPSTKLTPQERQCRSKDCNCAFCDRLEMLEKMRTNLVAIVSHELRTPLCTIKVCLETLANEPEIPREYRQKMLDIAINDIERLRQVIQDFFTLSRLERKQLYHRPESLQLIDALDLLLSGCQNERAKNSLPQVTVKLPPQLPALRIDVDRLVEVLTKLLDNARKFTAPNGEITIQARLIYREEDTIESIATHTNPMLEVIVTDTGRGIAPTKLEAIFNHFYQEEDPLRRTAAGTGIGLTICRQIINSLGGKIWASSVGFKQGSEFHFTVPVCAKSK